MLFFSHCSVKNDNEANIKTPDNFFYCGIKTVKKLLFVLKELLEINIIICYQLLVDMYEYKK